MIVAVHFQCGIAFYIRKGRGSIQGGSEEVLLYPRERLQFDAGGLTDEQIADNIIGVIFAARDTTASVLTWILKYLAENPSVLQAVTEEQEAILKGKEGQVLCWEDTKKMPLTSRVIQETLRVASILSFTFREAVEDVEFEGLVCFWNDFQGISYQKGGRCCLSLETFITARKFPRAKKKFDPSRFEEAPKPNTFMPFGSGIHACPGNELAKLEILILVVYGGPQNGIQYGPFALPQNGLPIRLSLKETHNPHSYNNKSWHFLEDIWGINDGEEKGGHVHDADQRHNKT
nr:abscisic acid 8'-hydroxylase 1-like [Ipomoea trifida]